MALLKRFTIISDANCTNHWIKFEDFYTYLRTNLSASDGVTAIKKDNVRQEMKKCDCFKTEQSVEYVSAFGILKYVFNHSEKVKTCNEIAREVLQHEILHVHYEVPEKTFCERSTLDLYQKIAKFKLKHNDPLKHEYSSCDMSSSTTLFDIHKSKFNKHEWNNICLFEYHFSQSYSTSFNESPEKLLEEKWKQLDKYLEIKNVASTLHQLSKKVIKKRDLRKKVASPEYSFVEVFENCFEVYAELAASCDVELSLIGNRIVNCLHSSHMTEINAVVFFKEGTFMSYMQPNGKMARFSMRDDVLSLSLEEYIVQRWLPEMDYSHKSDSSAIQDDTKTECETCFSGIPPVPLNMATFDRFKEWILDVPLEIQILLEAFLNKRIIARSDDPSYLQSQIERLHSTYDILLNTSNFHYIGLLQEANTQSLLMHSHSIVSVFEVTSRSGISSSLKRAEDQLKIKAMDDYRYYDTFIRPQDIQCPTLSERITTTVSMRITWFG